VPVEQGRVNVRITAGPLAARRMAGMAGRWPSEAVRRGRRATDWPPADGGFGQQAARARGLTAAAQGRGRRCTLIVAASLACTRRRGVAAGRSGGGTDGAEAAKVSAVAALVTLSFVTPSRNRKVVLNVRR
jgi:hypothetical protein